MKKLLYKHCSMADSDTNYNYHVHCENMAALSHNFANINKLAKNDNTDFEMTISNHGYMIMEDELAPYLEGLDNISCIGGFGVITKNKLNNKKIEINVHDPIGNDGTIHLLTQMHKDRQEYILKLLEELNKNEELIKLSKRSPFITIEDLLKRTEKNYTYQLGVSDVRVQLWLLFKELLGLKNLYEVHERFLSTIVNNINISEYDYHDVLEKLEGENIVAVNEDNIDTIYNKNNTINSIYLKNTLVEYKRQNSFYKYLIDLEKRFRVGLFFGNGYTITDFAKAIM